MNESAIRDEVVGAIDDIRRPPHNLLAMSMAAVRADSRPRWVPRLAGAVAALIALSTVAVLVGVSAIRNNQRSAAVPPVVSSACLLPVRTDQGPGLLDTSSGVFRPAGLPAASATAYDANTHKWLPTQPQGISPDGNLVALLDNVKGHHQTLQLETESGVVLYSRDYVMRILGWSSDGSLLVTTVDEPARLLKISADGSRTVWIDPTPIGTTTWMFASGPYAWGVALPYPDPDQHREVVRLDLSTSASINWYALLPDSFNDSGYGPILGLTSDGLPIVPQLKTDARSGVYVIRSKDVPSPISVVGGDETKPSMFWAEDATGAKGRIFVTTIDGELYESSGAGGLKLVHVANSLHVYSFGGGCS